MESYKVKDVSFRYPGEEEYALRNVSFDIKKGEFITVCGASGSGKTTLLRLLKPIISPEGEVEGSIYFDGESIHTLSQREQCARIGFVMQDPDNQLVTDKVWHELAFGLESLGVANEEIRIRVSEMASFFGLNEIFHKDVSELSGGQKQLVNLASVMVMNPDVLILDEPTGQLDPISAEDFLDALSKINRELGTTVILSEHRLESAIPMCDRLLVMDGGKVIAYSEAHNVAGILKEKSHPMLMAMTTPMRVYSSVESNFPCPVSVCEGREWLSLIDICDNESEESVYNSQNKQKKIEIKNLYFRYDKNSNDIIKNLSLTVYKGEILSLMGANGAGKSTLLSIISRINTPLRGKIHIYDSEKSLSFSHIGVLSQDTGNMFAKKTIYLDYMDALSQEGIGENEKKERIHNMVDRLGISHLIHRHPYDLSGGERQRAAIGKLLLRSPSIILLDEPTKGMDAYFKRQFASILKELKEEGITVVMVSHDVEFCAEFSDRCALMFDGSITCVNNPEKFFGGNIFYTTSSVKMTRGIIKQKILPDDIVRAIGGSVHIIQPDTKNKKIVYKNEEEYPDTKEKRKIPYIRIILGILCAIAFFCINSSSELKGYDIKSSLMQISSILIAGLSVFFFLPKGEKNLIKIANDEKKLSKRTILATVITLLIIPLTILFGVYKLNDRKYYFISLMIILEIMLPFFVLFEDKKSSVRELIIISVLCAIGVAGRIAFYAVPQFKPVLAVVIIAGVCFGAEAGFLVGSLSAFVSNFYFLHGAWTPWQMFGFGIVGFLAGVVFSKGLIKRSKVSLSVFGFLASVIIYGGIMDPASVIMTNPYPQWNMIVASWLAGFHLNVVLGVSTAFFLYFASEPMIGILERMKKKYDIRNK